MISDWRLRFVQVAWGLVALYELALFCIYLPSLYANYLNQHLAIKELLRPYRADGMVVFYVLGWDLLTCVVSCGATGFIVWRKRYDWFALLTSAAFLALGLGFTLDNYSVKLSHPALAASTTAFLLNISTTLILTLASLFTFLFPSGRFVPRWLRWPVLIITCWLIAQLFFPALRSIDPRVDWILMAIQIIILGLGLFGQVYRYRYVASPAQRQQTKWVVWGVAIFAISYSLFTVFWTLWAANPVSSLPADLLDLLLLRPLYYLPRIILTSALVFSVLRYRLWDVDFLINRSLVYAALATILAAFFGISLALVSWLFQNFAGGSWVAMIISASVFGFLFQPARRALQRFVDRRFYGIQIGYTAPASVAPKPESGTLPFSVAGYQNLQLIGRGGMSEVYRANHAAQRGKSIAIKLLPVSTTTSPEMLHRFQREARLMRQLDHPNIIRILDCGDTPEYCYIAMEYIQGSDLSQHLHQRGRLPLAEVCALVQPLSNALDYAHAQGLVHRDIKPSNVMLAEEDGKLRPVLMDFGIAKQMGGQTMLTTAGAMVGTLSYVAPEQIQDAGDIDGCADVYAFGVMVYQMLAGELPFKQSNPGALLIAHLTQPPPDLCTLLPDLSFNVCDAVQKAMAKSPRDRFASVGEFVAALSG